MTIPLLKDWNFSLLVSILALAFYAGGFVVLTRNHLKHLGEDIKALLRGQKYMSNRITKIERRIR